MISSSGEQSPAETEPGHRVSPGQRSPSARKRHEFDRNLFTNGKRGCTNLASKEVED